ncbi:MAG: hypothetical protein NZM28_10600 [Fimbriimonadales bacterium]|nr:hypothetical protein [Fimbriimonadales bacterium]
MSCAYCERPADYQARAGLQRLRLCQTCAEMWARRNLRAPLTPWLRQLKPAPRPHTECPFCACTPAEIQHSGLYGCAFCYVFLGEVT